MNCDPLWVPTELVTRGRALYQQDRQGGVGVGGCRGRLLPLDYWGRYNQFHGNIPDLVHI